MSIVDPKHFPVEVSKLDIAGLSIKCSVAKERVETKSQKVFGLIPKVVEVTGKNLE